MKFPRSFREALLALTEDEARAVYEYAARGSDNERGDPCREEHETPHLEACERAVLKLELVFVGLAERQAS